MDLVNSYNFPVSNDFTQMVNFLTWIPDCNSHGPVLLTFFSSDPSICFIMAFLPFWNSNHVFVSVSTDFLSNSKEVLPLFIAQIMTILVLNWMVFVFIWEMFQWRISLNLVLLLLLLNFLSEYQFELMYIPHCRYQFKAHSCPWFSAACAAAIAHRNHFLVVST